MLLVTRPEDIKEVLGPKVTMESLREVDPIGGEILGKALFSVPAKGGDWKRQHRVCMRGFGAPRKLEDYQPLIQGRVDQMISLLEKFCDAPAGGDVPNAAGLGWEAA